MTTYGIDVETHLIREGQLFPRLVCLSIAENGRPTELLGRVEAAAWFRKVIGNPDVILVGHNLAFDLGVLVAEALEAGEDLLEVVFDAYAAGRLRCTVIRQKLLDIAAGVFKTGLRYDLAALVLRRFNRVLPKDSDEHGPGRACVCRTWRLHFAALEGAPVASWPPEAREYACRDAEEALALHDDQEVQARLEGAADGRIPDEARQAETAWVLHLMAGWGVRTDGEMVGRLQDTLEAEKRAVDELLLREGILRADGTKDMAKLRVRIESDYRGRGLSPPRTPKGSIQTGAEVLATCEGDPALLALADAAGELKLLSTYVPALRRGVSVPCTSRPNVLVDSGRTSWGDPNWQNPPRKGGIRECVLPRPGHVFCFVDFDTAELRALAQTCLELFGYSEMARVFERGEDPHKTLGAELLGLAYALFEAAYASGDAEAHDARQSAKAANFGFPGGMGVQKFLWAQRDFVKKLLAKDPGFNPVVWATDLREAWLARFYEMKDYFALAKRATDQVYGDCRMVHPWSGRVRGGLDYCSYANSWFQGRVADGAKLALRRVSRECYAGRGALRGCRPVLFLHDEIGCEMPEDRAAEAAAEMVRVMIAAMSEVIDRVPIRAKPVLCRRWYKGAEPVYVDRRLVPSKPVKDGDKTVWVSDLL